MRNLSVGVGMRISAAAKRAPCGGLGGVIKADAMMVDVPLGAGGISWTVSVELSSCKVNRRSSDTNDIQMNRNTTALRMTYCIWRYVLAHCLSAEV